MENAKIITLIHINNSILTLNFECREYSVAMKLSNVILYRNLKIKRERDMNVIF
jgi:hypothetical protein